MRYKANFRPQYILGRFHPCLGFSTFCFVPHEKLCTTSDHFICYPDPESCNWDPLDGEMTEKLNSRPYVSLSRDRASSPAPQAPENDVDLEEVSLFDIGMPGVLTVPQVEALDLDHWLLYFNDNFVYMKVRVYLFIAS